MATQIEITQDRLEQSIEMTLDSAAITGKDVTVVAGSPTAFNKIETGWDNKIDGLLSIADDINGHITAGRTGIAIVTVTGSFQRTVGSGAALATAHLFLNEDDTTLGFERTLSGSNDTGSFAGRYIGPVTNGDVISIRLNEDSAADTFNFDYISMELTWQT